MKALTLTLSRKRERGRASQVRPDSLSRLRERAGLRGASTR